MLILLTEKVATRLRLFATACDFSGSNPAMAAYFPAAAVSRKRFPAVATTHP